MEALKACQEGIWIVAVSGGRDSMALFDMCIKHKIKVVAAHVNYHKRETSDRDERCVRDYAEKQGIPLCVMHATEAHHGNFQAWARNVRYQYFCELSLKYQAQGVLIAHHRDDLLETYLLQKQRKSIPDYWGLNQKLIYQGIDFYRPLLMLDKEDCYQYCLGNNVEFCDDESNFIDHYARNRIRHQKIQFMSKQEKEIMVSKIDAENKQRDVVVELYRKLTLPDQSLILSAYHSLDLNQRLFCLRYWLKQHQHRGQCSSLKQLKEWDQIFHKDGNQMISLDDEAKVYKSYDKLAIKHKEDVSYCYKLDTIEMVKTPWFETKLAGPSTCAVTCSQEDFPLTIRNWHPSDSIALRFGTKKISRWFIDRKIPALQRKSWPIVLNRHKEIILVPHIGCNIKHFSNNPTMFVLK